MHLPTGIPHRALAVLLLLLMITVAVVHIFASHLEERFGGNYESNELAGFVRYLNPGSPAVNAGNSGINRIKIFWSMYTSFLHVSLVYIAIFSIHTTIMDDNDTDPQSQFNLKYNPAYQQELIT